MVEMDFLAANHVRIFGLCASASPSTLNMQWYMNVLQKEDNDWMKKCKEYEAEGAMLRRRPKKCWREIVEKDCQAHKLNMEDTMDRNR